MTEVRQCRSLFRSGTSGSALVLLDKRHGRRRPQDGVLQRICVTAFGSSLGKGSDHIRPVRRTKGRPEESVTPASRCSRRNFDLTWQGLYQPVLAPGQSTRQDLCLRRSTHASPPTPAAVHAGFVRAQDNLVVMVGSVAHNWLISRVATQI